MKNFFKREILRGSARECGEFASRAHEACIGGARTWSRRREQISARLIRANVFARCPAASPVCTQAPLVREARRGDGV
jgi:hypothetical protein